MSGGIPWPTGPGAQQRFDQAAAKFNPLEALLSQVTAETEKCLRDLAVTGQAYLKINKTSVERLDPTRVTVDP